MIGPIPRSTAVALETQHIEVENKGQLPLSKAVGSETTVRLMLLTCANVAAYHFIRYNPTKLPESDVFSQQGVDKIQPFSERMLWFITLRCGLSSASEGYRGLRLQQA
jgi:hypothetical protein